MGYAKNLNEVVKIYQMKQAEPAIYYSFNETEFGKICIASTDQGICYMSFVNSVEDEILCLYKIFPSANLVKCLTTLHQVALNAYKEGYSHEGISLYVSATPFQIMVWETLLKTNAGKLYTYKDIALQIGCKGYRAVGSAVAQNQVALLIPCHRITKSSGEIGNYKWGSKRKQLIIEYEKNI